MVMVVIVQMPRTPFQRQQVPLAWFCIPLSAQKKAHRQTAATDQATKTEHSHVTKIYNLSSDPMIP